MPVLAALSSILKFRREGSDIEGSREMGRPAATCPERSRRDERPLRSFRGRRMNADPDRLEIPQSQGSSNTLDSATDTERGRFRYCLCQFLFRMDLAAYRADSFQHEGHNGDQAIPSRMTRMPWIENIPGIRAIPRLNLQNARRQRSHAAATQRFAGLFFIPTRYDCASPNLRFSSFVSPSTFTGPTCLPPWTRVK